MNSSEIKERLTKIGECTREVEEKCTPRQMKELLMKYETETSHDLGRQFRNNEPWTHYVPCPVPVWSSLLLHTRGNEGQRACKCAIHHWDHISIFWWDKLSSYHMWTQDKNALIAFPTMQKQAKGWKYKMLRDFSIEIGLNDSLKVENKGEEMLVVMLVVEMHEGIVVWHTAFIVHYCH